MQDSVKSTYTSAMDGKFLADSQAVFTKLPEEAKAEACTSRSNLYAWLVNVDSRISTLGKNVAPSVEAIEAILKAAYPEQADKALAVAEEVAAKLVSSTFTEARLVSRQSESFPWEQTSFYADAGTQTVFAKVHKAVGQPIGHDDGTHYVPRETGNLLWRRQWGIGMIVPVEPPFKCIKGSDDPSAYAPARLNERQIVIINEGMAAINEELDSLRQASGTEKAEAEFRVRETIKLARIQLPRLDVRMSTESDKRPELGANYENVDAFVLGSVVLEYLALLLDEHAAREGVANTTLVNRDVDTVLKELKADLLASLDKVLRGTPIDEDSLASIVTKARVGLPGAREFIDSFAADTPLVDVSHKLRALLVR